jgi:hypothetical protein
LYRGPSGYLASPWRANLIINAPFDDWRSYSTFDALVWARTAPA